MPKKKAKKTVKRPKTPKEFEEYGKQTFTLAEYADALVHYVGLTNDFEIIGKSSSIVALMLEKQRTKK